MAGGFSDAWMGADRDGAGGGGGGGRRRKGVYEDIVDERRLKGDLGWVLRSRQSVPRPAFCSTTTTAASGGSGGSGGGGGKSPAEVKQEVLRSDRLTYGLREISLETGRPMPELLAEAGSVLDEMAHSLNMFAVRSFGYAVAKVMKRLYRGVYVNSEGIAQLRKACSEYPVVLMPMHRSYADFLLLSLICFDYDLPLPAIASAMDFMGMRFIGSVLRNCGAFFIRRSFATDRVYWLTFVEYVQTHVRAGLHPVEFFLEGTRSRSGKSLYPKTGMLGAILESWFMCEVPDIYLVPVSISYDRVLEEQLYAYELLGVPKPKESTAGLLKARALLSEDFGSVHFYFDRPISLRRFAQAYGGGVDRGLHSLAPKVKAQLTEAEVSMMKAAAHHVVSRQCANAIISPFCLMAALLLANGGPRLAMSMAEMSASLAWLRGMLANLGASVDWAVPAARDNRHAAAANQGPDDDGEEAEAASVVRDQCQLHRDLVSLVVMADASWIVPATSGQAATVESLAATGLRLCSYRNQLMYHLAGPALAASLASVGLSGGDVGEILCHLLHREFPLLKAPPHAPPQAQTQFLLACLRPFLIGCWLVCRTVMEQPQLLADAAPAAGASASVSSERRIAKAAQAKALARLGAAAAESSGDRAIENGGGCCGYWDCVSLDLLVNAVHGLHRLRILVRQQTAGHGAGVVGHHVCDWAALGKLSGLLESIIGPQPGSGKSGAVQSKL